MKENEILINQLRNSSFTDADFKHPSGESNLNMELVSDANEVNAEITPATPFTPSVVEITASVIAT
ncbi:MULTISPECIES: hypothetical protein [Staphylococcus]|uniref:hypothetical protein n=1 Tax=Staphylococcus TaxID=1279 RepID=UPI001BDEB5DE|nr:MULTISPECIES: hypothetical protein [Staphylococcus]MBU7229176.1 hypothetical protein [Staphylococcus pseudintermedius]MCO4349245.1 hypothetical protein [Staphylococcus agnetis]HEC2242366.1 hypothetical protein [Staphylococcus delphini]